MKQCEREKPKKVFDGALYFGVRVLSRLTRQRSTTAGGGERGKHRGLFHKIKRGLHSGQRLAPAIG